MSMQNNLHKISKKLLVIAQISKHLINQYKINFLKLKLFRTTISILNSTKNHENKQF